MPTAPIIASASGDTTVITGRGHKVSEAILARHSGLADRLKQLKTIEFPQDSILEDGSWSHTTLKSVHPGEPTPLTRVEE